MIGSLLYTIGTPLQPDIFAVSYWVSIQIWFILETLWPTSAAPLTQKWIKHGTIGGSEHHCGAIFHFWPCFVAIFSLLPISVTPSSHVRWLDPQLGLLTNLVWIVELELHTCSNYGKYVISYVKYTSVNSFMCYFEKTQEICRYILSFIDTENKHVNQVFPRGKQGPVFLK